MKRFNKLNIFPFKTVFASFSALYFLNYFKNRNILNCYSQGEDKAEFEDVNIDNDAELNLDEDFMQAIQDPTMSDEEKQMFKRQMKQMSIQPLPFSKYHAAFKLGLEEEKWNGMRFVLEFNPNQMNKLEYTLIMDNKKLFNNYKISAMSIIPFSDRSQNGAFLMGRKEGDQSLGMQCHLNLTENDKILCVASHPKPDLNQGHYVVEYNREFERLSTTIKVSNMELSASASASIYKNLFAGFEAVKHFKSPSIMYNYGICMKPSAANKFAFAVSWMNVYPALSIDFLFQANKNWSAYFTFSKNWHPMAMMSGHSTEIKMSHNYTVKNQYDLNMDVDHTGNLHFLNTYYYNKQIGLQMNLELNPFAAWSGENKKVFRTFGVGIKFATNSVEEELMNSQSTIEESFEEYEYDRIITENIK